MKKIIELQNIKRNFQVGDETVHALRGIFFTIMKESLSLSWVLLVPASPLC